MPYPNARLLLRSVKIEVLPESFSIVSINQKTWAKLLENPELSPRLTAPFMIFRDKFETTLLLDEIDFEKILGAISDAKVERNFRLLTFDKELPFNVFWIYCGNFTDSGSSRNSDSCSFLIFARSFFGQTA